ncbi:MAG: TetR/AcrR family transcriptional regulator [Bacillota bacterium]|nr:TetR/AcrR family transcriptional regulator [Bacillota bacterium]
MPKETFFNLDEGKKEAIIKVLIDEFTSKPFKDVTVKGIVDRLQIARGSFYQYFEDLEDSYFFILDRETHDVHLLFMKLFAEHSGDILRSLEEFGTQVSEMIFDERKYPIYRNRYLSWNEDLDRNWNKCHRDRYGIFHKENSELGIDGELVYFIRAVLHSLIERNFRLGWTKEVFLETYKTHLNWMKEGVIQ